MTRRRYWLSEAVGDEEDAEGCVEYACIECNAMALIDGEAVKKGMLWECEDCGTQQYLEELEEFDED